MEYGSPFPELEFVVFVFHSEADFPPSTRIQPNTGLAGFGKQGGGWLGHGVKMSRLLAC
jgi:hypothetical protein